MDVQVSIEHRSTRDGETYHLVDGDAAHLVNEVPFAEAKFVDGDFLRWKVSFHETVMLPMQGAAFLEDAGFRSLYAARWYVLAFANEYIARTRTGG